jgi:hypothetical protein
MQQKVVAKIKDADVVCSDMQLWKNDEKILLKETLHPDQRGNDRQPPFSFHAKNAANNLAYLIPKMN